MLKRRDISHKKQRGEGGSSDFQAKTDWLKDVWPKLRERYSSEDILNCDETGLYFRLWPDSTLAFKHDTCKGFKKVKAARVRLVNGADPLLVKAGHDPTAPGHHQVQFDGPYNRKSDHISEIFYCMKVNSVRDQQKIDHIPEKTIYPMTI